MMSETRDAGEVTEDAGEFVLYWLHHAYRAEENPALDVACQLAHELRLPLLIYQGLSERYKYASDRHHRFMLEGARDLQQQFEQLGLNYVFHLERPGHRGPHLRTLAARAAVVVTEEMPVEPIRSWRDQLDAGVNAPLVSVDTACVVPMFLIGKPYERAFQFRQATKHLLAERLERPWPAAARLPRRTAADDKLLDNLPFEPIDLGSADLDDLIASCEIDHGVGPVPHTPGGSAAGYQRWREFLREKLRHYARRRNDPLADATSRLSPYLHYGMVSPLRIARDASREGTAGAEKFLDELLVWRELAYTFCFHHRDHESLAAIPDWARQTLDTHRSDRRSAIHSWETLARAKTYDPLWSAAQQSLLIHGELHNNVRMTWGKQLLHWTPDAARALAMMIDLNHRYALDGRDPASYGGLLWCLGQFDRPFRPERPVLGSVRERSTADHARRLDVPGYRERVTRPLRRPVPSVAVIGAGLSGLTCARTLADHGIHVTVFEKSRGVGGRMATRRTPDEGRFDHGAQYFTVRDERFRRYVDSWRNDGIVELWPGRIGVLSGGSWQPKADDSGPDRYVGVPGMNAVCRHLAADLEVCLETRIAPPKRTRDGWSIHDDEGRSLGAFDYVVCSAPAPQTAELLPDVPGLAAAARVSLDGCWAILLTADELCRLPWDAAFVHDSPLAWVARNRGKPGRPDGLESWILHATPEWSRENLERRPEEVLPELLSAFERAAGLPPLGPSHAAAHRWRYALPPKPLEERSLFDASWQAGACGDWCSGPRVEGAFLSGLAIAGRVLNHALLGPVRK